MRKFLKKSYTNNVLIWQNTSLPRSKTNPLKPAPPIFGWGLMPCNGFAKTRQNRWVQQGPGMRPRAYLLDLITERQ